MEFKLSTKVISLTLSMLMVFMAFPAGAFAIGEELIVQNTDETTNADGVTVDTAIEPYEVTVVGEETSLRDVATKHFKMSDGSYSAVTYGSAVHYESDGEWVDIDNTLSDSAAEDSDDIDGFAPKNNDTKIKFAKKSNSSKILALKYGDARISFSLNGDKNKVSAVTSKSEISEDDPYALPDLSSRVTYADIFDGIDLIYDMNGMNVKESFVLHSDTGIYEFSFEIKVKGVTPSLDDEGNIIFISDSGEEAFMIPTGFMYDAEGARSQNVTYSLSGSDKKYTLTITADEEWISADERSFPVTVDPTIVNLKYNYDDTATILTQTYNLDTGAMETDTGNMTLGISSDLNYGGQYANRIKATTLPALPDNTVLTKAYFGVYQEHYSNGGLANLEISAYRATSNSSWYSSYNSTIIDYVYNNSSTIGFQLLDITTAYLEWLSGAANYGITLIGTNHSWQDGLFANSTWVGCASNSDYDAIMQPRLILSYRNTVGVEGLYTYESYSAGRAGNVYVSHNSGQVTVEVPLLVSSSDTHPYTLSAIYNTHHSEQYFTYAEDDIHTSQWYTRLGHGWKLSAQQSVYPKKPHSAIDGTAENYLIHTDSDGTEHYYKQSKDDANIYESEEGSKLYIEKNVDTGWYYLRDEEGAFSSFDEAGYIRGTADKNGNKHYYTYTTISGSQKRLDNIYRQNLGQTAVRVAKITYSGQNITSITDEFGGVTTFTYTDTTTTTTTIKKLTSITRPDGTGTTINYGGSSTNFKIWKLYDNETKYGLQFAYSTGAGVPLSSVKEYCYDNGTLYYGAMNTFTYNSSDRTTVTYCGKNAIKDTDASTKDDMQYITLFDHYGRTVCAYTYDPYGKKVYSTGSVTYAEHSDDMPKMKNKVTEAGSSGVNNANMLTNAGFESGSTLPTGWTKSSSMASTSEVVRSSVEHYTGSYSLRVTANASSSTVTQAYMSVSGLTPNLGYTFSAYIKTSGLSGTGGAYLQGGGTRSRYYQSTSSSLDNGWQKISVNFTPTSSTANICCGIVNSAGTVYFDNVQLERHPSPSMTSLVSDGGAEKTGAWTFSGGGYSSAYYNSGVRSIYVDGSPSAKRYAKQSIAINRPATATYVVSGWGMAHSAPLDGTYKLNSPTYGFLVRVVYSDNSTEDHVVSFNSDITSWQFVSAPIVPKQRTKTVSRIDLFASYDYNVNTAWFDDICLAVETCTAYKYDVDGNVSAVDHTAQSGSDATYNDAGNPTQIVDDATGTYNYTYDSAQNLLTSTWDGIRTKYTYENGLNTETTVTAGGVSMESKTDYNSTNDHIVSTTDVTGRTVNYSYSIDTGANVFKRTTQDAVLASSGANINELYDIVTGRILLLNRQDGDVYFTYENGKISTITPVANTSGSTNSAILSGAKTKATATTAVSGYQYAYSYDKWGNLTKVTVGGKTLKESTYHDITGEMLTSLLPFGDKLNYSYDICGRVTEIKDDDGNSLVKYTYDGQGNISKIIDNVGHLTSEYGYDSIGRLLYQIGYNWGTNRDRSSSYSYDSYGRLTEHKFSFGTLYTNRINEYHYNSDGTLKYMTTGNGDRIDVTYDAFNRVTKNTYDITDVDYSQRFTYASSSEGNATPLISKIIYNDGTKDLTSSETKYDGAYNVTELWIDSSKDAWFEYDSAHRLKKANYANGWTYEYTYDNRGNILTKKKTYRSTGETSTINYGYGGTQADALKSYGGKSFTYNAYGYPTSYNNGSAYTFSWDKYGNLSGATKGSKTLSYSYDISGLRTSKAISGGLNWTYYYDGDRLIGQVCSDGTAIMFNYGTDGEMFGFSRMVNGYQYDYYYVKNAQGDVLKVMNQNMDIVARYYYDAWGAIRQVQDGDGNIISDTTSQNCIANINPIRYRGYYYDIETGLYYLQTRYYDPEIGRFISRDSYEYIGANGDLGSFNLFAYCSNNPVNGYDPCGTCFHHLDIWNDCDKCGGKNLGTKISDAVSAVGSTVVSAGKAVGNAVVSAGKAVGNAAVSAWNWTKEAAQTAWGGVKAAGKAVGNFVVDRFSTPEKASNTLDAIEFTLGAGAAYCGGVAAGLSLPTLGMSIPTAGTAAAILAIASLPFHGVSLVIDFFAEE